MREMRGMRIQSLTRRRTASRKRRRARDWKGGQGRHQKRRRAMHRSEVVVVFMIMIICGIEMGWDGEAILLDCASHEENRDGDLQDFVLRRRDQ